MIKEDIEKLTGEEVISSSAISGGCIASSNVISAVSGKKYFVKSYSGPGREILRNEFNGLKELKNAGVIRVPEPVGFTESVLIIEYIESGRKKSDFFNSFGAKFARLHRVTSDEFGFFENNFIGATPQVNLPRKKDWTEFYITNRLGYQIRLAEKNGYNHSELGRLYPQFEKIIPKAIEGSENIPSLLHGDLWGGNYLSDENGEPVLIDPAVYYGNREADLAMTRLFGGFSHEFYEVYNEEYPLPEGWQERVDIYKLYHVLNHLNLFGTSYLGSAISIIKSYIKRFN